MTSNNTPSHEPGGQQAGKAEKLAEEYMRDIEDYSIFDNMDNQEQAAAAFQWLFSRHPTADRAGADRCVAAGRGEGHV